MMINFILGMIAAFLIMLCIGVFNSIPKENDDEEQLKYLKEYKEAKSSGKYNNKIWKSKDVNKI
jgi:hypothetical protein